MDNTKYYYSKLSGPEMEERLEKVETLSQQVDSISEQLKDVAEKDISWIEVK